MADDGFARAIFPSHTMGDGDTVFSLATGTWTTVLSPTSSSLTSIVLSDANTGWAVGTAKLWHRATPFRGNRCVAVR